MKRMAPKPNLFIVGAPKCGTTALYRYLRNHPEVFMSPAKEPQFFAADIFANQRNVTTLAQYLECFAGANGQKKIGEASTCYLGSGTAASEIKAFSPTAQIVIMVRNPVDVMYAQHSERIFGQAEHVRDFEAAVDSNEERKWKAGPFKGERAIRPGYRELSRFTQAVKRYFDAFRRENVHVIIYDDFVSDAAGVFGDLLRFLEVGPAPVTDYSVVNGNRRARSMAIQEFIRHPPKRLWRLSEFVLSKRFRAGMGRTLRRLNVVYEPRPPMNEGLRRRLQKECEPDVEELSHLLDRDLTHWCRSAEHY
jgi:hypothetical protein